MSTEFKAVTPQRAVEIMKAWACHPWPMTVQDGIDIHTGSADSGGLPDSTADASGSRPDPRPVLPTTSRLALPTASRPCSRPRRFPRLAGRPHGQSRPSACDPSHPLARPRT